ncbi:MAG: hypothetical protein ACE5D2_03870 [Fidelibacterota bacterium]
MSSLYSGILFLLFTLFVSPGFAQDLRLAHEPPITARAGETIVIKAASISDDSIQNAKLYYRLPGNGSFLEENFKKTGFYWEATIPGDQVTTAGIEYIISFQYSNSSVATFPINDPFDEPYFLVIETGDRDENITGMSTVGSGSNILILSPDPTEILPPDEVLIAASFFNAPEVDLRSVRLLVDGNDKTNQAMIADGILSYTPSKMTDGLHSIEIQMTDTTGAIIQPNKLTFKVGRGGPRLADVFDVGGQVRSRFSLEKVSGITLNISELTGNLEADVKWAQVQTDFKLTSRETEYRQPQSRLGAKINFGRFLTINFGDFYPHFSPFTIDGIRIRGIGVDADLNWVRFQFVKGELNRAVQHSGRLGGAYAIFAEETATDTTGRKTYVIDRRGYTFQQNILSARFSINIKSKLLAGIHIQQVRDDKSSINANIPNAVFTVDSSLTGIEPGRYTFDEFKSTILSGGDSLQFKSSNWRGGDPVDNLVLGFNLGTTFDQKRLSLDFNWNLSLYNRNIWDGAMSRAAMDTAMDDSLDGLIGVQYQDGVKVSGTQAIDTSKIIIDPIKFENIFTINTNMSPLVPIDVTAFKSNPLSTIINMPSSAFNIKLQGKYALNRFTLEYRQVGPGYVSLGNPFLRTNIREFSINDRLLLMDQRLILNGGFKHQDNKILRTTVSPLSTNTFFINTTILPGPGLPSFTFNYQSIGKNNEKTDLDTLGNELVDLREDSKAATNLMMVTIPFELRGKKQNLILNFSTVNNTDQLSGKRSAGYLFPKTDTKSFGLNFSSSFENSLRTIVNFSRTQLFIPFKVENEIKKKPYTWTSGSLSGQYRLLNQQIKLLGATTFLLSQGAVDSKVYGVQGGMEYAFKWGLVTSLLGNFRINSIPSYNSDKIDNDQDGKIDESGEAIEINTSSIFLTFRYNF